MHAIFFDLKRAHHASLKFCRSLCVGFPSLTPARFDVLHLLQSELVEPTQRAIRAVFGVARATMSEMLSSLEAKGLVRRGVFGRDRRTRYVELTRAGHELIERAYYYNVCGGIVPLALDCTFEPELNEDSSPYWEKMLFTRKCRWVRLAFQDTAAWNIYREWDPDD